MASTSSETPSSSLSTSSSSLPCSNYDVFLSFRGDDTRHGFTDHLYEALRQRSIFLFRDNEKLRLGQDIAFALTQAIENSQYAIVVFSERYADSRWCLDELVEIVKCRKNKGLKVVPVFYHVDPSDVRKQTGRFGKAFAENDKDDRIDGEKIKKWKDDDRIDGEKIKEWKDALRLVGSSSGQHLIPHQSYESKVVQEIAESIFKGLNHERPAISDNLVGINYRVQEMMNLFGIGLDDVRFIGIWGMAGIGKTTQAKELYRKICQQFEVHGFISDVRETHEKYDLVYLQNKLLSEILKEKDLYIWNSLEGSNEIKKRLKKRKVVIVIDDVDKNEQLEALAGSSDWFGPGSRIIITCRDKNLLERNHINIIYGAKGLYDSEALEFFSRIVFKKPDPEEEFEDLPWEFVKYAKGLPLAIRVLGSSLIKKSKFFWKDTLDYLKERHGEEEFHAKLEIAYKGLNDSEKSLFLDIACFFKGEDENRVAHIEGSGCYRNLESLKDKSLITILRRKLWMHDLLQEMGWGIVRRKSPEEPGSYSRLWLYEDVFHVLKNNTGTELVESMVFNSPQHKENLNVKAFSGMKRLRLIKICNVHLPQGLDFLSNKLRSMEWHDYPLQYMPMSFQPNNLVELIMPRSLIEQLPEGFSNLAKLRIMDLSNSQNLIMTPDFKGHSSLQKLIFRGCTTLLQLHPSVGALKKLELFDLKDCKSLKSLPSEINLESLEIFILSGCSRLKNFPEIRPDMTRLSKLYLDGTAIEELPLSIEHLSGLTFLSLQDCKNFSSFPRVNIPSLKTLVLSGCKAQPPKSWLSQGLSLIRTVPVLGIDSVLPTLHPKQDPINFLLPRLSGFSSMESLDVSDCNLFDGALPDDLSCLSSLQSLNLSKNNFTHLPDSIDQLPKLKFLELNDCKRLQTLPNFPLSVFVKARGCTSLKDYSNEFVMWTSPRGFSTFNSLDHGSPPYGAFLLPHNQFDSMFKELVKEMGSYISIAGFNPAKRSEVPEWFNHQSRGSFITIPLPSNLRDNSRWRGVAFYIIFEEPKNPNDIPPGQNLNFFIKIICHMDISLGLGASPVVLTIDKKVPFLGSSSEFFSFLRAGQLRDHLEDCSCISALIKSDRPDIEIKICGARIMYEEDLVDFTRIISGRSCTDLGGFTEYQLQVVSGQSVSNIKLIERKLESLLSRLYEGDRARNHKYDYIFPCIKIPTWFRHQSFCPDLRIKLLPDLQKDKKWIGIAVCASYTVKRQPVGSGDNQDLTSFLNFYNPLGSNRLCLTRHKVFQDSRDVFVGSLHRILVFYIPHMFLRLPGYIEIEASFEPTNPGVQVKECGIRLLFEQDIEEFVQTLVQCMLQSPEAYHSFYYQGLFDQVAETVADFEVDEKKFGYYSSLQRMPQTMPKLPPTSIENIVDGCNSSETISNQVIAAGTSRNFSPSLTSVLEATRKGQPGITVSGESMFKENLQVFQKDFEENEIIDTCFAQCEIPEWFRKYEDSSTVNIQLKINGFNSLNWMGIAVCALFSFNKHPTAVRMDKDSGISHDFHCLLRANSRPVHRVWKTINEDKISISLTPRKFIWVLFFPRATLLDYLSETEINSVQFEFRTEGPDLFVQNWEFKSIVKENKDELMLTVVQCSTPPGSILDCCDPKLVHKMWNFLLFKISASLGLCYHYEGLYPQPQSLFISEGKTSGTAQYSYDQFRYFYPSTSYNSCFPTRRTLEWFNHQSRGHSVTIDISRNLYDDNNWIGLALYASFSIPKDYTTVMKCANFAKWSHFLYCQLQTSRAGQDDQIRVCQINDEETNWLFTLYGFTWISYIPGEAFKDMLHQCGHIKASFVSDWGGVTVQKCGVRLLYQHDQLQFERELQNCNALISGYRDFIRSNSSSFVRDQKIYYATKSLSEYHLQQTVNDFLDRCSVYSRCFPPVEILHRFSNKSNKPSVTINIPKSSEWMGLVVCAYFSVHDQTAFLDRPNSTIPHQLFCLLESNAVDPVRGKIDVRTNKEEFLWLDVEGGFLWLSYLPFGFFPDRAIQDSSSTSIEVSFVSDWPGVTVQKCGLCFFYEHDEWLQTIINRCWQEYLIQDCINLKMIGKSKINPDHNDEAGPLRTSSGVEDEDHHEIPRKPNIVESSGSKNQLSENDPQPKDQRSQNDLLKFDRCLVYNAWFPLSEILEWCDLQSDVTHVTIPVPPNLFNDCAWIGLALIASFEVNVNEVAILDIQDSEASFNLNCYLGSDIVRVKRFYTYDLTKDIPMLLHQGGLVWLCYIPRESFRDSLNQCSWIRALIQTNCPGLTVQKCGLHLSYDHDEAELKETIRCCKAFFSHRHEVRSSIPSSSNNDDAQPERQRQGFNDEAGPRRTSSSIEDLHQEIPRKPIYTGETSKAKQLGENDPHPKDQHCQSDLLDFDQCLVYSSCLPPCKILEWFRLQSDEPQLRIPLPPNLHNDSTWMGLALCISFEVNVNGAAALEIEDSETSYYLICHLEASIECVEPLHVYCLTREHLKKLLQLGGFNWLFYISHGSFRDSLNQCTWIEAKIGSDYPGLTVQKCGLHLLYQHEEAEFKETIRYHTLFPNEHEVRTSILSSSNNEESRPERQRGRVDPVLKGKGKQVLE